MDVGLAGFVISAFMMLIAAGTLGLSMGSSRRTSARDEERDAEEQRRAHFSEQDTLMVRLENENARQRQTIEARERELAQVITARDEAIRQRDHARAEVEQLRAQAAREHQELDDQWLEKFARSRLREAYWRQTAMDLRETERTLRRALTQATAADDATA